MGQIAIQLAKFKGAYVVATGRRAYSDFLQVGQEARYHLYSLTGPSSFVMSKQQPTTSLGLATGCSDLEQITGSSR